MKKKITIQINVGAVISKYVWNNANVTSHVEVRKTAEHGMGYSLDQATAGNPSFLPCKTNTNTHKNM